MSLLNKTFAMPKNKGGGTWRIRNKIRGMDRYSIVKLGRGGKEIDGGLCAGSQWLKNLV